MKTNDICLRLGRQVFSDSARIRRIILYNNSESKSLFEHRTKISNMSLSVNCSTCPSSVISPTIFVDPSSKTCTVTYSAVCAPYAVLSNFPRAPYSGCSSHLLYCDKYQPFSTLRNVRSAYTCPPYSKIFIMISLQCTYIYIYIRKCACD